MLVARELAEYKLFLGGVQEVRCDYAITEREGDLFFFLLERKRIPSNGNRISYVPQKSIRIYDSRLLSAIGFHI